MDRADKLGPRPSLDRAYRPIDRSKGQVGLKIIFFKARGLAGPWRPAWLAQGGRPKAGRPGGHRT